MPRRPSLETPAGLLPLRPIDLSVLLVLSRGKQYGYGIAKAIANEANGAIVLAPGNLYQVLDRLIDWRLIRVTSRRPQPGVGGERRRHYDLTPFGRQVLTMEAQRLRAMASSLSDLEAVAEAGD